MGKLIEKKGVMVLGNRNFNEERHEYTYNETVYRSVTELLGKHGLTQDYSMVDPMILQSKAQFGNRVHKAIEMYIKGLTKKENLNDIALSGINELESKGIVPIGSEYRVWLDEYEVAGTIDIIGLFNEKNTLIDIKTTYVLNKNAVAWQLGFYGLLSKHYLGFSIENYFVLWLNNKTRVFELVEIEPVSETQILELLKLDRDGKYYGVENTNDLVALQQNLKLKNILYALEEAKAYIKDIEEQYGQITDELKKAMSERSIKSFEDDDFKITYVESQERVRYDYKKFVEDNNLEISDEYKKITNVKDSIRITRKDK